MTSVTLPLRRWLLDPDNLLLVVLLLLHVAPLWWFAYFPSQDGPAHLENATILREWGRPDLTRWHDFYTLNPNPEPNWVTHLVLAGLMYVVPGLVAEKMLLTGYLLLLPFSVRYALHAVRPGSEFLALLSLPLLHNLFYHLGFYNFCYSLPVFFYVVGYWMRHQGHFTLRHTFVLALLALLLYFCHLVSLVMAGVAIGMLALWLALLERRSIDPERKWVTQARSASDGTVLALRACELPRWRGTSVWSRLVLPGCAFLPAVLLTLLFLGRRGGASGEPMSWTELWVGLRSLESLVSYNRWEGLVSTGLALFFAGEAVVLLLGRFRSRGWGPWDGWLLVAVAYTALYFFAPAEASGGMFVNLRLNLFPFFALLLWFGTHTFSERSKRLVEAVATVTCLLTLGLHVAAYAELNDYLREYLSGMEQIEPNSRLLPLCFAPNGRGPDGQNLTYRVGPFRHAAGYLAAERRLVDLDNYEANSGYFPLRFRPEVEPYVHMGKDPRLPGRGLEAVPPCVDFLDYPAQTGQEVDYVLIWGVSEELRKHPCTESIYEQLDKGEFKLIYKSPQRGLLQLYRHNP
jgi:hypothetical protein